MLKNFFLLSVALFALVVAIKSARAENLPSSRDKAVFDCVALSGLVLQATDLIKATKTPLVNDGMAYLKRTWEVRRDFGVQFAHAMRDPEVVNSFYDTHIREILKSPSIYFSERAPQSDSIDDLKLALRKQRSDFTEGLSVLVELQHLACEALRE